MRSLGRVALPPPPSANRLWRTFRGRQVRSAEATRWMSNAAELIRQNMQPTEGSVEVWWQLRLGKGVMVTADLDNFQKILLDTLRPPAHHKDTGQLTKPGAGIILDDNLRIVKAINARVLPEQKTGKARGDAEIVLEVIEL